MTDYRAHILLELDRQGGAGAVAVLDPRSREETSAFTEAARTLRFEGAIIDVRPTRHNNFAGDLWHMMRARLTRKGEELAAELRERG